MLYTFATFRGILYLTRHWLRLNFGVNEWFNFYIFFATCKEIFYNSFLQRKTTSLYLCFYKSKFLFYMQFWLWDNVFTNRKIFFALYFIIFLQIEKLFSHSGESTHALFSILYNTAPPCYIYIDAYARTKRKHDKIVKCFLMRKTSVLRRFLSCLEYFIDR